MSSAATAFTPSNGPVTASGWAPSYTSSRARLPPPGLRPPRSSEGAAESYVVNAPLFALASSAAGTGVLGDARARELRARGADMDWDQAINYTLAQTTQALNELKSETQP